MGKIDILKSNISENKKKVFEAFINGDEVRADHYNGENGLYSFEAMTKNLYGQPILNRKDKVGTERNLTLLHHVLTDLPVKPDQMFVWDDYINLVWGGRGIVFENKYDYMIYALQFAEYIDSLGFDNLEIQTGSFGSDPVFPEYLKDPSVLKKPRTFEEDFISDNDNSDYSIDYNDARSHAEISNAMIYEF